MREARWQRYRHKANNRIEYDVEVHRSGKLFGHVFKGELCFRIRTIRNIANPEEVHQPAYTMMPADKFFDVYQRVEN